MTQKLKHLPFIFLWLILTARLAGQEYMVQVQHFSLEEGLSHRSVHYSLQDRRGMMWFGTDYGLNRFDGYRFKWITKEKHGLQSNLVTAFFEDRDGLLWLLYGYSAFSPFKLKGIDLLHPVSAEAERFETYFAGKADLLPTDIIGVAQKENGTIAFLTETGDLVSYAGAEKFSVVPLRNGYEGVDKFHWSANGHFWFSAVRKGDEAAGRSVYAVNEKGEEIHAFPLRQPTDYVFFYSAKNSPNEKWVSMGRIPEAGKFQFYEATPEGQLVPNAEAPRYAKWNLDFSYFMKIAHYVDGGDFACFSSANGFYFTGKDPPVRYDLVSKYPDLEYARHLYIDQQGRIWVSTQFGIYLITLRQSQFTKIMTREDDICPVRGLAADQQNRLWVVRENQRNIWTAELSPDRQQVIRIDSVNQPGNPDNLPFSSLYYPILQTKNGWIYYPSKNWSLTGFNPKTLERQTLGLPITIGNNQSARSNFWGLFEASDGTIWATSDNGRISSFGKETGEWLLLPERGDFNFIAYQLIEDGGAFWVVTEQGLFLFDKKTKQTKARYWSGGEGKYHLPFDKLHHAYRDEDGSFWLANKGNGLVHFDPDTGEYQQFTRADGLSNNVIYAIYPDAPPSGGVGGGRNLWLSSDYGLMRFNKTTSQVNTYLEKDGISHHEFNRISHHQSANGHLFFGSLNGITAFHPSEFSADSSAFEAPLVISNFQQFVNNENQLVDKTEELLSTNEIVLAPGDPFSRLAFSLLSYEEVDKIRYAYKIEGQDDDWFYQRENFIRLGRLPYGEHLLRIKGQGADGQWSENELAIRLRVLKPFYIKFWFILLCAAIVLGLVSLLFLIRNAQLKRQRKHLEFEVARQTEEIRQQADQLRSLDQLKSKVFANISHELRTPLTLILGPISSVLKSKKISQKEKALLTVAKQNAGNLGTLVSEILDLAKTGKSHLELHEEPVALNHFIGSMVGQYESILKRVGKELTFDYRADQDLTLLLDKEKLRTVLNNFISNAIKYTRADGKIEVQVSDSDDTILLKVSDNGIGIHADDVAHVFDRYFQSERHQANTASGTGIGLALCREIAKIHKGNIWVESEFGKGSSFHFSFPKKVATALPAENAGAGLSPVLSPGTGLSPAPAKEKAAPKAPAPEGQKEKILVVEDNVYLQDYLEAILGEQYEVLLAGNGKEALEILEQAFAQLPEKDKASFWTAPAAPALIISDVMMPIMDGFELLEKLKTSPHYQPIPVIMLTALAGMDDKLKALRIGVDDYMSKPFEENELLARVENLVARFRKKVSFAAETAASPEPDLAEADQEWLQEVESLFLKHLSDTNFNMEWAAGELHLSKRQVQRRLKQLTGLSPNHYLLELRLQSSRQLLLEKKYKTVKEVAYAVGFKDPKYFSRQFSQRFGKTPSDY